MTMQRSKPIPLLTNYERMLQLGWIDLTLSVSERCQRQAEPVPEQMPETTPEPARSPAPAAAPEEQEEEQPAVKLLRFLDTWHRQHGQMPTYAEIASQHLGVKYTGHARYCVVALEKAGLVRIEMYARRGIAITDKGRAVLEAEHQVVSHACPTCGAIMRLAVAPPQVGQGVLECPACKTVYLPETPRGPYTLSPDAVEGLARGKKVWWAR